MKKKILADFQIWISVPLMFMFFYKKKTKIISSDKILCTWLSPNNTPLPDNLAKIAFKKCGCRLKCKKYCAAAKEDILCLPILKY